MAVDPEVFDEMLARLEPLGDITYRPMFGGYGFYEAGAVFAYLHRGGTLYLKADGSTEADFVAAGAARFGEDVGRSMPYWAVPDAVFADDDRFADWARRSMAVGHATKARPRKAKPRKR